MKHPFPSQNEIRKIYYIIIRILTALPAVILRHRSLGQHQPVSCGEISFISRPNNNIISPIHCYSHIVSIKHHRSGDPVNDSLTWHFT